VVTFRPLALLAAISTWLVCNGQNPKPRPYPAKPGDIFANLGDIRGEAIEDQHRDEIDIDFFRVDSSNANRPARDQPYLIVRLPQSNDPAIPGGEFSLNGSMVSAVYNSLLGGFLTQVIVPGGTVLNGFAGCPNGPFPTVTCGPTTVQPNVTTRIDIANNTITNFSISNGTLTQSGMPLPMLGETAPMNTQIFSADPISTATGFLISGPDPALALGGPLPLTLAYFYSSGLGAGFGGTSLGFNWMTNFDPYVVISGNLATVNLLGGGTTTFKQNGGVYQTLGPAKFAYQFVKSSSNYRFLHIADGLIYDFDSNGRLIKFEDRNGNALTVTQGPVGPTQVSDGLGRTLTFTYTGSGVNAVLTKVTDQTGRSVSFTQDNNGNVTSFTDANGNKTSYSYNGVLLAKTTRPRGNAPYTQTFDPAFGSATAQTDSFGNTTKFSFVSGGTPGKTVVTDPLGRATTFNYADLVNISSATDAAGQSSSVAYDVLKRPLSFTDRLGNKTSVTYDPASGFVSSRTDPQGNTTIFTYQAQTQGDFTFYNLSKVTFADGTSETYAYDASGNVVKATDRAGKTTTYTYNSRGQALTITNASAGVTTYTYNSDATIATVRIPSGDVTTLNYDNLKRVSKLLYADNTSRSVTRDALNQVLSITDERGKVTKFTYDANNNRQSVTDALNQTSKLTFDTDDLPNTVADALGNTVKIQYDPLGSVTAITNAAGEKTSFTYERLERLSSVADPAGKAVSYTYDAEGRLATVTDALGNVASLSVNKNGLPTQFTSPLAETSSFSYDSLNRIASATDAVGRQSTITYDNRGLPLTINAPGGIRSSFTYGDFPLLASLTDPNGGVWSVARDNLGRTTSATDPLGQTRSFKYDARSRISSIATPLDSGTLTYDSAGNLTGLQFSDNTALNFTYDDDSRLTGGTGLVLGYDAAGRLILSNGLTIARNAAGRIASIVYAPGKTVTYTYDSRGLLSSVTDWTHGSASFAFNDASQLVTLTRSNGVSTKYTYDKDGRLASIADSNGSTPLVSIALTRDAIGRITASNRTLTQESSPSGGSLSLNYDAANQIAGAVYDARGRLTNDNAGATYTWNSAARLTSYSRPDGAASFTYDALGQRVSRTASGATRNYVLNYATVLPTVAAVQSAGADLRYYIYTPQGSLLFSVEAATGAHRFYSFDNSGSTTLLTDDTGTITDAYGISPYGEAVTARTGNTTDNPFTWQGQFGVMQEPGSGLFYSRFRYYDSSTARFLSRDPVVSPSPRQINPYQFAAGNPVTNTDPSGLKTAQIPGSGAGLINQGGFLGLEPSNANLASEYNFFNGSFVPDPGADGLGFGFYPPLFQPYDEAPSLLPTLPGIQVFPTNFLPGGAILPNVPAQVLTVPPQVLFTQPFGVVPLGTTSLDPSGFPVPITRPLLEMGPAMAFTPDSGIPRQEITAFVVRAFFL